MTNFTNNEFGRIANFLQNISRIKQTIVTFSNIDIIADLTFLRIQRMECTHSIAKISPTENVVYRVYAVSWISRLRLKVSYFPSSECFFHCVTVLRARGSIRVGDVFYTALLASFVIHVSPYFIVYSLIDLRTVLCVLFLFLQNKFIFNHERKFEVNYITT